MTPAQLIALRHKNPLDTAKPDYSQNNPKTILKDGRNCSQDEAK
jgi:hypothetical protein